MQRDHTIIILFLTLYASILCADTLSVSQGYLIIGMCTHVKASKNNYLIDIAETYGIGVDNLMAANPQVPLSKIKPGTQVLLPKEYILPSVRKGIVINLPEKRLYYFDNHNNVYIFPVAVGRVHHNSTVGSFKITEKRYQPTWNPPSSVRQEERLKGNILPAMIGPGPENPLGDYAMRINNGSTLIHGTNFPPSIGKRSTSGCFGMYPDDIKELYPLIAIGTPVTVINEPIKIARGTDGIYIESHPTLEQTNNHDFRKPTQHEIHANIQRVLTQYPHSDPLVLYAIFSQNMGIPISLGPYNARNIYRN